MDGGGNGVPIRSRKKALDEFTSALQQRLAENAATESDPTGEVADTARSPRAHQLLGELLVELGLATGDHVQDALVKQAENGELLGQVMVELGMLSARALSEALARQQGFEFADLRKVSPSDDALSALPDAVARRLTAMPLRLTASGLEVAVTDPLAGSLREELGAATGCEVRLLVAPRADIEQAIERWYRNTALVDNAVRAFESMQSTMAPEETGTRPTTTVDANAPIVQVVNLILEQAIRDRASDVHIEPEDDSLRVRNRTDGALHEALILPASMAIPLVSRIKVMADMNIVERRRPQDGQFAVSVAGRDLDVRVATAPNIHGEKCVLRLLDKSRALLQLGELGMPPDTEVRFKNLVTSPYGMVICAGPTGSGKTTTLYATLSEINSTEINITTIEDPVEYVFPRINQMQINAQAGVTFVDGLRSILRQDPDAILVGEIRDVDTARIAVQSALTGHFVMSSLHATDSVAALNRFIDMGIERFLIASSLLGIVAQRLVRRTCPSCKVRYEPTPQELSFYELAEGPEDVEFFHGEGCNFCGHTGYFERVGVYEVLRITDNIRRLIVDHAPNDVIRTTAVKEGMRTLANEAALLVANGTTTITEVLRTIFVFDLGD